MYCPIFISSCKCLLNELLLWSDVSSEHPIFIKTVAELTKKNLSKEITEKLMHFNKIFSELNNKVQVLIKKSTPAPSPQIMQELGELINQFLIYDKEVLKLLPEIKQYGKEDKVWQTLLEHITREQTFMYEMFSKVISQ